MVYSLKLIVESLLFAASEPLTPRQIRALLPGKDLKEIKDVLQDLKENIGSSIILITHDLGVIAETAQTVIVMYAGKIMEYAPAEDLFENPCHPYTVGLMQSVPSLERDTDRLPVIPGLVPSLFEIPPGCAFNNRCNHVMERCLNEEPPLVDITASVKCRCWLYE